MLDTQRQAGDARYRLRRAVFASAVAAVTGIGFTVSTYGGRVVRAVERTIEIDTGNTKAAPLCYVYSGPQHPTATAVSLRD